MEPVPETERMEEFRDALPTLRLQASSIYDLPPPMLANANRTELPRLSLKPPTLRRCTDPTPHSPRSPISASSPSPSSLPYRPRNTSPYSRGHLRSKSSSSPLAPPMVRAQSMPGFNGSGHLLTSPIQRPASPRGSPSRSRPLRKPVDEVFPGLPVRALRSASQPGVGDIPEDIPEGVEERETSPRPYPMDRSVSPVLGLPHLREGNYPRSRRPSSPLRYVAQQNVAGNTVSTTPTTPVSVTSSPSYNTRFNDAILSSNSTASTNNHSYPNLSYSNLYPLGHSHSGSFTSSSVPSTPTSARSRSPSISSLETIPDSPDAEAAALEAERIAQLKADADAADDGGKGRAGSLDTGGRVERGRTLGSGGLGGFGVRDKRKRWSVCGAERRGDLNLDTIWED